jgi:flagellar hook-length control protein FliK
MSRPSESVSAGGRVSLQMMAPVASSEWRAELGDKLSWLVGRQAQTAELVLNPPSLGTIEVRLNMNMSGNETGAQFFTANANVRDALEAAFPRLRELLAGAGITLGDTTVSSQSFAQQREQAQTQGSDNSASQPVHGLALGGAGERFLSGPGHLSGLVDLYI